MLKYICFIFFREKKSSRQSFGIQFGPWIFFFSQYSSLLLPNFRRSESPSFKNFFWYNHFYEFTFLSCLYFFLFEVLSDKRTNENGRRSLIAANCFINSNQAKYFFIFFWTFMYFTGCKQSRHLEIWDDNRHIT